MGASITITPQGFVEARQRLLAVGQGDFIPELLESVSAVVESQTRLRIQEDKTDPDGGEWPEWSPAYATSRHEGHSLLQGENSLVDSIQYLVGADQVSVGSNLVYAGVHQRGHKGIPARPYLGLSEHDATELQDMLDDFVNDLING